MHVEFSRLRLRPGSRERALAQHRQKRSPCRLQLAVITYVERRGHSFPASLVQIATLTLRFVPGTSLARVPRMDTHPTSSKPEATSGHKTPKRVPTSGARPTRSRQARGSVGRARRKPAALPPSLGLDAEQLAQLQEDAARKLREVVREQPLLAVGAALATGFVLGGGWRTRIGRFMLAAGVRFAATEAAKRYVGL
jgi:hypothetical protein